MPDSAPLLERAFDHVPDEGSYRADRIEGNLPDWIRGSYYLNGPARFGRNGIRYRHWLDGDGMVCALHFSGSQVTWAARFVRSMKYSTEEREARAIFRTFGTAFEGDRMKRGIALESPVNVSVYPFCGRLLAFGEQGLPWALDPVTLETQGLFDFGGALNEVSPFSAHPKFDPGTGEMYNFGVGFGAREPALNLYRFAADGHLVSRRRVALEHAASIHDFALTSRFAVIYEGPYVLDMSRLMAGNTLLDSLDWQPDKPAVLLVIDRESGQPAARIQLDSGYVLHLIHAFDSGGRVTTDLLLLDRPVYDEYQPVPELFRTVSRGRPVRLVADLESGRIVETRSLAYDLAPDFPNVDARRFGHDCSDFWMTGISAAGQTGRKFFDQLVHARWDCERVCDVWQAPPGQYIGSEPVFIADPRHETNGVVVVHLFDAAANRSRFAVFDAAKVAAGPIASIELEAPIHLAFHGCFAGATA
jgi:all-trans-8'-apo-beta-carotenal 15,15'-oxygenase